MARGIIPPAQAQSQFPSFLLYKNRADTFCSVGNREAVEARVAKGKWGLGGSLPPRSLHCSHFLTALPCHTEQVNES